MTKACDEARALPRQPGNVLHLPVGTTHIFFGELPHLLADALWPEQHDSDEGWRYTGCLIGLEDELPKAVDRGELRVRDPLTFGPHTFPIGDALQRALVTVEDLRSWLAATRGPAVSVVVAETAAESVRIAPNGTPRGAAAPTRVHRIGRDVLAPVIDRARSVSSDGADTARVMAELERLARLPDSERPAPLAGVTSGGVQWRDGGVIKTLTRKALGDRLRRWRAAAR